MIGATVPEALPKFLLGIGAGAASAYQLMCEAGFSPWTAVVCIAPVRVPYPTPAPLQNGIPILIYGGQKDATTFCRHLRHGHSVRGPNDAAETVETARHESPFAPFMGYQLSTFEWAPSVMVRNATVVTRATLCGRFF